MKIEVKNPESKEIEYPCLMEDTLDTIVLFTKKSVGTVVASKAYSLGYTSKDWPMRIFKPFKGKITLSND